jgi:SnoaL-like domain
MGSESIELVRRVYLAWQAGDLDELLSLVDPEVSWSPVLRFLEEETPAVGHQGLRRWFRRIRITYRSLRPVPQRFEDHGSRVLVLGRLVGASRLGKGISTLPWRGSGPSAPAASSPCRPFGRNGGARRDRITVGSSRASMRL